MSIQRYVAQNITRYRLEARLTKTQLAKKIRKDPRYVTKLEDPGHNPTVDTVAMVAKALGVAPAQLLQRPGSEDSEPLEPSSSLDFALDMLRRSIEMLEALRRR